MSEVAIATRGLEKHFGTVAALRPLDLEVPVGSLLAVLGPNGAGKSTLLRLLAGLARPSGGSLQLAAAGEDRRQRRGQIGLVAHQTLLYPALTARENLILAGRLYGVADPGRRADELLAEIELSGLAQRRAGGFSRGTGQRLAIARALVHDPAILLLDEPFSGLDPRAADWLAERLGALRSAGRTLVLTTHDLRRAAALADRALLLVRGWARLLPAAVHADAAALERAFTDAVAPEAAAS